MKKRQRTAVPILLAALAGLAACATPQSDTVTRSGPILASTADLGAPVRMKYAAIQDGDIVVPAVDPKYLSADKARQEVTYWSDEPAGTIIVDPWEHRLYLVEGDDKAIRYTVAVGKAGRGFSGNARVAYQREWPRWTPTKNMLASDPELYGPVRAGLEGGLENPLGARALYLYRGGKDTRYRIHGTYAEWSIGQATSAGCIRLFNQDSIDLASRVEPGTKVIVLPQSEAGKGTVPPGQVPVLTAAMLGSDPQG
ncbi:L,D-transpeptidase [Tropicimonas sp. IMCC34043]|uniref:L,D-transpeptidase n=1 Tax=Tropicimonas sp. IMCC34043 TaxID=2248760 RepID=UPI000E24401A|nr:L,D-transpeptidase [Tropicimonas sp. IMCC34043]